MPTEPAQRQMLTVDYEKGTVQFDPDVVVAQSVTGGLTISADWSDSTWTVGEDSFMPWGSDQHFGLHGLAETHAAFLADSSAKTPQPVYKLDDF